MMRILTLTVTLAFFASLAVSTLAMADVAQFRIIDSDGRHLGQPVIPTPPPVILDDPSELPVSAQIQVNVDADEVPETGMAGSIVFNEAEIEPANGIEAGGCVLVEWNFDTAASLTATADAESAASVGGFSDFSDWQEGSDPLSLLIPSPSMLVLNPGEADEQVIFSFGPEGLVIGDSDLEESFSGQFQATIGDVIRAEVGAGGVAEAEPGNSATATAMAEFIINLRSCEIEPVSLPTSRPGGLIFLIALMLVIGLLTAGTGRRVWFRKP